MNYKIFALSFAVIALGAGCSAEQELNPTNTQANNPPTQSDDHASVNHVAKLAGARIDLENRNNLKPGSVTFRFKLFGLDGHEFGSDDLKIAHEKKMHLLLVRDDMTQFQHLHPEVKDGKWAVQTTISEAGAYNIYVDIAPNEESPTVLRVPVTIGGPTVTKQESKPAVSAQDGSVTATLVTSGPFKTNEHTQLRFQLTKNNQPAADIAPYLGAFGHVVAIRHGDADDFFHVHPVTETKPTNGVVEFDAQFPITGRYTLYAQFNVGGSVKTFPITIDVTEKGADTDTTHGHGAAAPESESGGHHN